MHPGAGSKRTFEKHPLAYNEPEAQRRAAKTMLANYGKIVGRVWAIDDESIAYTNTHNQPFTAYIVRSEDDKGWTIAQLIVAGWPVTT